MTGPEANFAPIEAILTMAEASGVPHDKVRFIYEQGCDRERDEIADWLEGWADGYSGGDEAMQTAIAAFATDIREGVHR
jgi:hypothetical protein